LKLKQARILQLTKPATLAATGNACEKRGGCDVQHWQRYVKFTV